MQNRILKYFSSFWAKVFFNKKNSQFRKFYKFKTNYNKGGDFYVKKQKSKTKF